jgi:hypothetical protein
MNPEHRKNSLAVLINNPRLQVESNDLAELQALASKQLAAISQMERASAVCAILAGITFFRVKASLPRGEWMPWLERLEGGQISTAGSNFKPLQQRQVNNYMRLASAFVEKAKLDERSVLAAPQDEQQLTLETEDAAAKRFAAKLQKFVGECSLNELLVKHNIKAVARDPAPPRPPRGPTDPKAALWLSIEVAIKELQRALNDSDRVHYLGAEEYAMMENHLRSLLNLIDERRPRRRGPVVDV